MAEAGAIIEAVDRDDAGEVGRLLEMNPSLLEARDEQGETALIRAAHGYSDGTEVVRLLLDRGADVNAVGEGFRNTALMWAAAFGHIEKVLLLLSRGADASLRDSYGRNALVSASEGCTRANRSDDYLPVVEALLQHKGQDIDERNDDGETALFTACFYGNAEVVRALLLAGADRSIADDRGSTPREIVQQEVWHMIAPCQRAVMQRGRRACVAVFEVGTLMGLCLVIKSGCLSHDCHRRCCC